MPTPAVTLKLKKFRRRFGIAAPKVAVRTHLAWQWYVAALVGGIAIVATIVWSLAQYGETASLRRESERLNKLLLAADDELLRLRSATGTEQNAVQMERTAQEQLIARLKVLEGENAALKEDIALFERLVPPADGNASVVRVERLRVTQEPEPGHYRYRLLVGFQASKQIPDFKGRLQLLVVFVLGGKDQQMPLPGGKDLAADYQLDVRHFLRKEGGFVIPAGARLKSVEVRVFQGDTLRAKRLAQL